MGKTDSEVKRKAGRGRSAAGVADGADRSSMGATEAEAGVGGAEPVASSNIPAAADNFSALRAGAAGSGSLKNRDHHTGIRNAGGDNFILPVVMPFEPVSADRIPGGGNWAAQIKWDGVRMLTYYDGTKVRLVNRKLNERTGQYPELLEIAAYCKADSVILDGEIIAMEGGKPSFHQVMRRDGIRRLQQADRLRKEIPIAYMVFDLLYLDGEWTTARSLEERQQLLRDVILPNETVQLVENYPDGEQLFAVMKQHGMEGIVAKDLSSAYQVNGKDARWRKIKNIRDLIAVVGGVTYRGGQVNALLLGLYDESDGLIYIGHAGTGKLSAADWRTLTALVPSIRAGERPFRNQPERSRDAIWVEPVLKVKVNYMEWTAGGTLRQPSIQSFVEVDGAACTFGQT